MERVAVDTSVIIPALIPSHPDHAAAGTWMRQGQQGQVRLSVAAHGLAETFATLTARAPNLAVPPVDALRMIRGLLKFIEPVDVCAHEYLDMIVLAAEEGLNSGVIYDAIHYAAAIKAGADRLLTRNLRDFYRLCATPGFVCNLRGN